MIPQSLHPSRARRIARLEALGATAGTGGRWPAFNLETLVQHPWSALLGGLLLLLLVPLGVVLMLAVLYLTAIAMTLGLVAGLAITAGVLG